MTGRHRAARGIRGKWSYVVAVVSVFGLASLLLAAPASAATTSAQLSLTGIATTVRPTGGSCVGVNPGDSVQFSPATVPLSGLTALSGDLASVVNQLNGLLGGLTGLQIRVKLPSAYPNRPAPNGTTVTQDSAGNIIVKLGTGGAKTLTTTFPTKGLFAFSWTVWQIAPLGLTATQIQLSGAQLATLTNNNVAVNASNEWQGSVRTDGTCPAGVSIQLPAVSAAPKAGPVQVPKVGVPGVTVPNVGVSIPSQGVLPSGTVPLPKKPPATLPDNPNGAGNLSGTNAGLYQHPGDRVVPQAGACCGDVIGDNLGVGALTGGAAFGRGLLAGFGSIPLNALAAPNAITAPDHATPVAAPVKGSGHRSDLMRNLLPAGGMPVVLAVIAILALSVVAATYARLYLVRRDL